METIKKYLAKILEEAELSAKYSSSIEVGYASSVRVGLLVDKITDILNDMQKPVEDIQKPVEVCMAKIYTILKVAWVNRKYVKLKVNGSWYDYYGEIHKVDFNKVVLEYPGGIESTDFKDIEDVTVEE